MKAILSMVTAGLLLAACGEAAPKASQPVPVGNPPLQAGTHLYLHDFNAALVVTDAASGREERRKPMGVISPDGHRLYAEAKGVLTAYDLVQGSVVHQEELGAHLPQIDIAGTPGGLSANGRWLVLTRGVQSGTKVQTIFVLVDTSFARPARSLAVPGAFDFAAISDDGRRLFLTGWPPTTGYQVQMFDIAAGRLDPANLVDRASPPRVMRGSRQSSVVSEDGSFVYSVYPDSSRGAFVHALAIGAGEPYAFSVDLPPTPGSGLWSLNLGRQGSAGYLFASNLGSGLVVELKLGDPPRVTRTLRLSQPSANRSWFVTQAQAKDELGGLGSTALATHGKSLYVAFGEVVHVVDTTSMKAQTRWLEGRRVTSIALNPDGSSLYATTRGSDVVRVDPRSGQVVGQVTIPAAYLTLLRVTVTG